MVEHLSSRTCLFLQQSDQEMLGSDILVPEPRGASLSELERSLRACGIGKINHA